MTRHRDFQTGTAQLHQNQTADKAGNRRESDNSVECHHPDRGKKYEQEHGITLSFQAAGNAIPAGRHQ